MDIKWGKLRLASLGFVVAEGMKPTKLGVKVGDKTVDAEYKIEGGRVRITLRQPVSLSEKERLEVTLT